MNVMKILIGQTNGTTLTIGNVSYSKFLLPLRVIKYFYLAFISIILLKLLILLHNGGTVSGIIRL